MAARRLGWWMVKLDTPVDWIGWQAKHRRWLPIEIKSEAGDFTPAQEQFMDTAKIAQAPVLVWRTLEDVERSSQ